MDDEKKTLFSHQQHHNDALRARAATVSDDTWMRFFYLKCNFLNRNYFP